MKLWTNSFLSASALYNKVKQSLVNYRHVLKELVGFKYFENVKCYFRDKLVVAEASSFV